MLGHGLEGSIVNMQRTLIHTSLTLVLLPVLAACSGSASPSKSIKVTMTDFSYSPNTFTVPAGEQISIEVTNTGAVQHSLLIMKRGYQVQGHFTDADTANVYWEQAAVPPGKTAKGAFTAPAEPGEYQIVCGVAGHFEAGMVATLKVVNQP